MTIKVVGVIIGVLILIVGLYYLVKERNDRESRKIYGIVSVAGGLIFAVMLTLTVLTL